MLNVCSALRDHVKALLRANLNSWSLSDTVRPASRQFLTWVRLRLRIGLHAKSGTGSDGRCRHFAFLVRSCPIAQQPQQRIEEAREQRGKKGAEPGEPPVGSDGQSRIARRGFWWRRLNGRANALCNVAHGPRGLTLEYPGGPKRCRIEELHPVMLIAAPILNGNGLQSVHR
jgi:hypothetical protein